MIQGNVRMFFFVFANKNVLYRVKIYSILNGIFVCSFYKFATSATPAVTNKNIASPTTTASSIKKKYKQACIKPKWILHLILHINAFHPTTDVKLVNVLHSSRKTSVLQLSAAITPFGNDCNCLPICIPPTATYFQYSIRINNTQDNTLCVCIDRFVSLNVWKCVLDNRK